MATAVTTASSPKNQVLVFQPIVATSTAWRVRRSTATPMASMVGAGQNRQHILPALPWREPKTRDRVRRATLLDKEHRPPVKRLLPQSRHKGLLLSGLAQPGHLSLSAQPPARFAFRSSKLLASQTLHRCHRWRPACIPQPPAMGWGGRSPAKTVVGSAPGVEPASEVGSRRICSNRWMMRSAGREKVSTSHV